MMLALFGATGLTGPSVLREALERGHHVKVLARDPAAVKVTHERLEVIRGNALVEADVDACVAGCDAVLHCLGVGGKGDGKPTTLVSESIALLLPVARAHRVKRLVIMSNYWAGDSGSWLMRRFVIPVFVRWLAPILDDKNRMEAMLNVTGDLEWIAIRFPAIVEGPAKRVKANIDGRAASLKITTGSIGVFMLDHLEDATFVRKTPAASN